MEVGNAGSILTESKKDKKEYQAQITALKKQAKTNKKNRKELLLEIAKLEDELTNISIGETDPQKILTNSSEIAENADVYSQKLSKAQKRRDRKANEERERKQRIDDQEVENKFGPRNLETSAINKLLKDRNLILFSIPSDGDCLYRAIEHQLSVNNKHLLNVTELRQRTADYLRENIIEIIPFMTNKSNEFLNETEYENYCCKVETTKAWAGQIEIKALSSVLKQSIEILQAIGPPTIQGEEYNTSPLILTYHRHMFGLGEHYNSTRLRVKGDSEDEGENQL